jgi:hypothetical protein
MTWALSVEHIRKACTRAFAPMDMSLAVLGELYEESLVQAAV